ncbi:MAG: sigma-70 family RNA polymerase sigma factor [bacterium]
MTPATGTPRTPDDSPLTRITLIQRLRVQQDAHSWQEFVSHYQGYIHRLARRMGLNHHDAEETVQDVCLKAWKALPTFSYDPGKGRFRGWLWQVTANEVRGRWRNRQREVPLVQTEEDDINRLPDPTETEAEKWAEEEWRAHVAGVAWRNVCNEFEERTRQVFEKLSKGTTPETVATELGLASSSVYVYKKRVQDRLKQEIRRLNEVLD